MQHRNLYPSGRIARASDSRVRPGEASVPVTERLASFIAERASASGSEYVQLEDGTYDLHPDIRWCPADVVPDDEETDPPYCAHEWIHTGSAYGGEDGSYCGEGRCYCSLCGADGDV